MLFNGIHGVKRVEVFANGFMLIVGLMELVRIRYRRKRLQQNNDC
ncbi:MAG: hypothetical protein ACJAW0_000002 [Zhongshania sp.]